MDAAGFPDWQAALIAAAETGPAWSALHGDQVLGCGGVSLIWPGRARCWCVLTNQIPQHCWVSVHRHVLRLLDQTPALGVRRLEADTALGFGSGSRWLRMLGFEDEGVSRAFGPDGADFRRFARVLT